jgi:uncharacterized protein (DUF2132 family)
LKGLPDKVRRSDVTIVASLIETYGQGAINEQRLSVKCFNLSLSITVTSSLTCIKFGNLSSSEP